ncbi:sensor histidine kinase [Chitinophaga japonensis]|uniref:Histidine kinase n=1 Tax=Chitinophaga japonensis TaxID=104662 RepID=A0A562SSU0_CHIJA|nr:sensor histidine kinase [Chitinophaga japonensis]TWI84203.1 histidine kinase [Chitinophaga japonensis]
MQNLRWRIIFPVVYGLIIYTSIRLVNDIISDTRFWLRPWQVNAAEICMSILACYVMEAVLLRLLEKNQQRYKPPISNRALVKEFAGVALWIELVCTAIIMPVAALTDDGLQWYDVVNIYLIPLLYWLLYYAFARGNAATRKSYEQQLQIEKISNDQLQAELRFLKAQYHPHFLFNALNTVYFQMDEDVGRAKQTIEELSELLRYQLYDQQQTVTVRQELQYLQSYIRLQKSRMNEHLSLDVRFDDALDGQQLYPLLLLPLVENAFKYAGGRYWIRIEARLEQDRLHFHVSNAKPDITVQRKAGGIGLEHLKRRLALLYPGKHTLTIQDKGQSFLADLVIEEVGDKK